MTRILTRLLLCITLLPAISQAGTTVTDSIDTYIRKIRIQPNVETNYVYQGDKLIVFRKHEKSGKPIFLSISPKSAIDPPYRNTHYYFDKNGQVIQIRHENVLTWKKEEHHLFYLNNKRPYHYRKLLRTKKTKELKSFEASEIAMDGLLVMKDLKAVEQLLDKSVHKDDEVGLNYFSMNDIKLIHGSIIPQDVKMGKDTIRYDFKNGDWIYAEYTKRLTMLLWGTHGPMKDWRLPPLKNSYFAGKIPGHVLVDRGTGPDLRELLIYRDAGKEAIFVAQVKGTFVRGNTVYVLRPLKVAPPHIEVDCSKKLFGVFAVDLSLGTRQKIEAGQRFTNQVFCL